MRAVRILVPGTTGKFRCGGLLVELQTARMLSSIAQVQIVTYRDRESDYPYFDDLLRLESSCSDRCASDSEASPLWIVSWGFDVPKLLRRLRGRPVAYHAHSSGYGFDLPPGVPVLAVSRNTLGYWGDRAPRQPLFLLPNALDTQWLNRGARGSTERRPIDVLIQQRKSSAYVLNRLVPALLSRGLRVEVQCGWVDDLIDLFNSASVYIYDSSDYWRGRGVSEGFGLPPLEALACGCVVFSSLNHALADCLDPGRIGHQIGFGSLDADVQRITAAVSNPVSWRPSPEQLELLLLASSEASLLSRWQEALQAIDQHWHLKELGSHDLIAPSSLQLRSLDIWNRLTRQLWRV